MIVFQNILLETLSFYVPMSSEQILLEMDSAKIEAASDVTMDDLVKTLHRLKKQGRLKVKMRNGEKTWLRINPRRIPWWKKIFYKLR